MTCIMGKSGIGKSTLLSILMGLEKADEGTVSGMEHQKISAIFQENRLFENLDAVTNIHITTGKTKEEIAGFLKEMELDDLSFCGLVDFFHGFCDFLRGRCRQTGNRKQ